MSVKLCMLAMTAVTAMLILRQWKSDLLPFVRLALTVLIAATVVRAGTPLSEFFLGLSESAGISESAALLCKAFGIGVLTSVCSALCRECGENGAASGIEIAGRVEILLLSLPLLREILDTARLLLSLGAGD